MAAGGQGLGLEPGLAPGQGLGVTGAEDVFLSPTDIILSFLRLRARVAQWREQGVAFFCAEEEGGYEDDDLLDVLQDMYLETRELLRRLLTLRFKRTQSTRSGMKRTLISSSSSSSSSQSSPTGPLKANLWYVHVSFLCCSHHFLMDDTPVQYHS